MIADDSSFIECDACRAKPDSPLLCEGCQHNREVIGYLLARYRTITLEELRRLCHEYDKETGSYPESEYQGQAVFESLYERITGKQININPKDWIEVG